MSPKNATTLQEDDILHNSFVLWEYPTTSVQNKNKIFLVVDNFPNSFNWGDQCFLQAMSQNGGILWNEAASLVTLESRHLKELNFGSQDFLNVCKQYLGSFDESGRESGFAKSLFVWRKWALIRGFEGICTLKHVWRHKGIGFWRTASRNSGNQLLKWFRWSVGSSFWLRKRGRMS